jgi:hypothetical protein
MIYYTLGRMDTPVVPAQRVNAIRAIDLYQSFIDKPSHAIDEFEVFVFVEVAHRGWEEHYRISSGAKGEKFHFTV